MFDKVFKLGLNAGLALLLVVVVFVVIVVAQLQSMAQTPPGLGPTAIKLQVVPTLRSVTISSNTRAFMRCGGGQHPWRSTKAALGFPNGYCVVGKLRKLFPIGIKNGLQSMILVESSNAVPADGGKQWVPCTHGSQAAVACEGPANGLGLNRPGKDQFAVKNFSRQVPAGHEITHVPACDREFQPGGLGGCFAVTGQLQRESLVLTGPYAPDDNSTKWSVMIIWMAVPAQ